jgi:DNA replication protein DnaD
MVNMDKKKQTDVKPVKDEQRNRKKWTPPVYDAGWISIPTVILTHQADIGINAQELNVLLQIIKHWWSKESLATPARKSIADSTGCMTRQTVQRHITSLKEKGLIEVKRRKRKDGGWNSSEYHFKGLIEKLTPFGKEIIKQRKEKNDSETKSKDGG